MFCKSLPLLFILSSQLELLGVKIIEILERSYSRDQKLLLCPSNVNAVKLVGMCCATSLQFVMQVSAGGFQHLIQMSSGRGNMMKKVMLSFELQ